MTQHQPWCHGLAWQPISRTKRECLQCAVVEQDAPWARGEWYAVGTLGVDRVVNEFIPDTKARARGFAPPMERRGRDAPPLILDAIPRVPASPTPRTSRAGH